MRKRSANVAAATGFCLCESEAAATTGCRSVSRYRMDAMILG
ncbi:hypothetical protein [Lysinibacillus agricola]|nr:hypothetical protein [Lysinibacillus agricola]